MYGYHHGVSNGGFKRGHGGRNYRPPPERPDKKTSPPPIKECACLIEIKLDEYNVKSAPQQRTHHSFGGRTIMEMCKKKCRNKRVHLVVPGRNQAGAVSLLAGSHQDALSACKWLLERIVSWDTASLSTENEETLAGRVILNLLNNDSREEKVGIFLKQQTTNRSSNSSITRSGDNHTQPHWFFQSLNDSWGIVTCNFLESDIVTTGSNEDNDNDANSSNSGRVKYFTMQSLMTCYDNVAFCNTITAQELTCILDQDEQSVFAVGSMEHTGLLFNEIIRIHT